MHPAALKAPRSVQIVNDFGIAISVYGLRTARALLTRAGWPQTYPEVAPRVYWTLVQYGDTGLLAPKNRQKIDQRFRRV
jgi:hypothetical protein